MSTSLQQVSWDEEFFTQQPKQHNFQIAIHHEYEHISFQIKYNYHEGNLSLESVFTIMHENDLKY